jgi:adenine-specific DNA-methyltransferase
LTEKNDWVLDPFLGTGTSIIAAVRHKRKGIGAELVQQYIDIAYDRINQAINGLLRTRPMDRPVFDPEEAGSSLKQPPWGSDKESQQMSLFESSEEVMGNK